MPEDGSKLSDVAVLADEAAQVDVVVPLAGLARLAPLLVSTTGTARGRLGFERDRGHVVADVAVDGELEVCCQRCLAKFMLPVRSRSRVALVRDEADVESVPGDLESALAPEGRIHLRDLVEEELLLALPGAPRHTVGECATAVTSQDATVAEDSVQRPFAGLAALLGDGVSKK